jgi:hypothetical protein
MTEIAYHCVAGALAVALIVLLVWCSQDERE